MSEERQRRILELARFLSQPAQHVTRQDPVARHQQAIRNIWQRSLELANNQTSEALQIALAGVRSSRQSWETQAQMQARLGGVPSFAFGLTAQNSGEDKPQHFFRVAYETYMGGLGTMRYEPFSRTWTPPMTGVAEVAGKGAGRAYEGLDAIRDWWADLWNKPGPRHGGYDHGDIYADDFGALFATEILKEVRSPLQAVPRNKQIEALQKSLPWVPPAPPAPPAPPGQATVAHTVRFGDRVWYLGKDYGFNDGRDFTKMVRQLNPGIDFTRLQPGHRIQVPTRIGVPTTLRRPYALRVQQELRPPITPPHDQRGRIPTQLQLLDRQLRNTPTPARRPDFLGSGGDSTIEALRRLERTVADRQQTQQWLKNVQRSLDRRPIGGTQIHLSAPTQLQLLDRQLRNTPTPARRPDFLGSGGDSTIEVLRRLERSTGDRQQTQQWLRNVQRSLDRRPIGGTQIQMSAPTQLQLMDQHFRRLNLTGR